MTEEKLSAREKRALKRRESASAAAEALGATKGSKEPLISALNYREDLQRALNHYNCVYDNRDKRKWTMSYVGKNSTKEFDEIADHEFRTLGVLIRLKQRDQFLEEKELSYIDSRLAELRKLNKMEKVSSVVKNPVKEEKPVVDKTYDAVNEHLNEFCLMIDEFISADKEPDFAAYLKTRQVPANVAKQLPAFFQNNLAELNEALEGTDKQLVEGYSFLKKPKLKKLIKFYESISDACMQAVVSNKVARKPRAVKEKPASILAKGVKCMTECVELGLKSAHPPTLVNSSEVWILNVKYKKLQVYRAPSGEKMTIKGTTLINYDVGNSTAKTLRKPEEAKTFVSMTKRTFDQAFKLIKTKESAVNGRINEDCIILKVW
jgi:hypothetical protein